MARTAELQAANNLKDELIVREQAAAAELAQAREREVEIGFRIQQTLLLDEPPRDVPGLRVAALTVPSQRIDGDFYVFFKHPDQRLDVIVGDVMGKGVPAALLGAATKSHFIEALSHLTALSKNGKLPEPKEIVTLAHAEVARHLINLESFVTLCYARLDLNKRNLDLVDCGHTGIIHLHSKTGLCEMVHGDNLPLGIREGEIFNQISVPFESGDLLLFYSDGVTEARNFAGELFGVDRLLSCVTINSKLEPEALVEAIRKATVTFSESGRLIDDLTCVALKIEEPQLALARAEIEIRSDLKELSRAREFVRTFCRHLPSPVNEDSVGGPRAGGQRGGEQYHEARLSWPHRSVDSPRSRSVPQPVSRSGCITSETRSTRRRSLPRRSMARKSLDSASTSSPRASMKCDTIAMNEEETALLW